MSWPPSPRVAYAPFERDVIAELSARIFAAVVDHAPHAHAFEYSEETVLQATCSARRYAVAQARLLLQEVHDQLMSGSGNGGREPVGVLHAKTERQA